MVERPEVWKWSSYRATAGRESSAACLTTDWVLGQFSRKRAKAEQEYRQFVDWGIGKETIWREGLCNPRRSCSLIERFCTVKGGEMKRSYVMFAAGVLLLAAIFGCKNKQEAPLHDKPAVQEPQAAVSFSGKIVETMNSGGYTFLLLEKNGTKTWVAIPETKVTVGQEVACQPGMEMKDYYVKTLDRSFASIYFAGGLLK
jgi:hypothetical protein